MALPAVPALKKRDIVQASEAPDPFPVLPSTDETTPALAKSQSLLLKLILFVFAKSGSSTVNVITSESTPL